MQVGHWHSSWDSQFPSPSSSIFHFHLASTLMMVFPWRMQEILLGYNDSAWIWGNWVPMVLPLFIDFWWTLWSKKTRKSCAPSDHVHWLCTLLSSQHFAAVPYCLKLYPRMSSEHLTHFLCTSNFSLSSALCLMTQKWIWGHAPKAQWK